MDRIALHEPAAVQPLPLPPSPPAAVVSDNLPPPLPPSPPAAVVSDNLPIKSTVETPPERIASIPVRKILPRRARVRYGYRRHRKVAAGNLNSY